MMTMLPKKYCLKNQQDFKKIVQGGRCFFLKEINFRWTKNDLLFSRFAVVVSTKVDKKAVIRNKIKRRIQEIIRHRFKEIKSGFDILVVTRTEIKNLKFKELKDLIKGALIKSRLLELEGSRI